MAFRLIKGLTPGPYTFILKTTHEVPRRLQNPRRKTHRATCSRPCGRASCLGSFG